MITSKMRGGTTKRIRMLGLILASSVRGSRIGYSGIEVMKIITNA